jgi:hypothetical protein
MTRLTFFAAILAVGAVLAPPLTRAQAAPSATPAAQQPAARPMAGQAPGAAMPAMPMMGMHEKMMADMKAMDVKLDALITKMNTATGAARVDAIAAALTALVEQHKAMHGGMMQMQSQMMMQMHAPAAMPMGAK